MALLAAGFKELWPFVQARIFILSESRTVIIGQGRISLHPFQMRCCIILVYHSLGNTNQCLNKRIKNKAEYSDNCS